jgi:signal peptidase I
MKRAFWETLSTILLAILLFIGLRVTIQTCVVDGPSMENTFQTGERILVDKLVYKFGTPQRGDIIIFHPPISSTAPFIKRIIGLPSESVIIKSGTVTVIKTDGSGIILQEPYIKESPDYNYNSGVIPPNEYFVLGDNRNDSEDSHYGWFVSRGEIIGKAWLCIWPPHFWGLPHNYRQPAAIAVTVIPTGILTDTSMLLLALLPLHSLPLPL